MAHSRELERLQDVLAVDARQGELKRAMTTLSMPEGGWIKYLRRALGMSSSDLAKALKVEVSTITRLEQNETQGRIKLETLRRVADEMGCDLVYGLVPREPIQETINRKASAVAIKRISRLQQTMSLEQQGLSQEALEKLIEHQAQEIIRSRKVWK